MAKVTFHQGIKALYDADFYKDGLYFATDTQELLLDGQVYGADSGSIISDMLYNPDNSQATLILVKGDGSTFEVTVTAASSELAGLMTATDKSKLDNINIDNYYTKDLVDSSLDSKADKSDLDSLSNNVSSLTSTVEANESALDNLSTVVDTKQDKLTAGNGIDITNNVVSTTLDTNPFIFVDSLPTSDIQEGKIYCIPDAESTEEHNVWDEYYYVDNNWELFGKYVPEVDLADYYKKSETYSQSEVNSMVSNLESHEVDIYSISGEAPLTLEGKYTEADHTLTITGSVDLSEYAKTTDVPTKTSDLTNDSGYITDSALNGYAKSSDIPTAVSLLTNDSGYITDSALDGYAKESELSDYAKKSEIIESILTTHDDVLYLDGYIDGNILHLDGSVDTYSKNEIDSKISTAIGGGITDVNVSGTSPLTLNGSVDNGIATITGSVDLSDYAKSDDLKDYLTTSDASKTYLPIGDYVTESELKDKQDKLSAKSPINISSDNEISIDLTDYVTTELLNEAIEGLTPDPGTGTVTSVTAKNDDTTGILAFSGSPTIGAVTLTASIKEEGLKSYVETLGYAKSSDIPTVPTSVSAFTNDAGYITDSALSGYAKSSDIPSKTSDLTNDSGYITSSDIPTLSDLGGVGTINASGTSPLTLSASKSGTTVNISGSVDLSDYVLSSMLDDYALKSSVPTTTSLLTNDSGYITTSALSDYATTETLNASISTIENELNGKLDTLTAGTGIEISGNTISTSGVITNVIVNSESPLTLSRSVSSAGAVTITGSVDLSDYQTALKYYSESNTGNATIDATRGLFLYGTRGVAIESTSGNVEITASGVATYNGNEIATVSDLDSYATTDQLASKLDILTAGDNITISNNVISATSSVNQILEDLREYYKDNLTALNELCFETETWQLYCLPTENCIVDYTESLSMSGYGSALVHFGFASRLEGSGNCLSIDGVPIPVFIDSTDGEAYVPVIVPVINGVCQKLEVLIKVTPLPATADDLAKKQDKLNYYTEGEESATIRVSTGEFIVDGGDIKLIASTKGGYKAYYNDKEIATVSDLENYATTSDLNDKQDKLQFYSESSNEASITGASYIEGIASDTVSWQGSEVNLQTKVETSSSSIVTNRISISDSISMQALIGDVSIKTADGYKATYNGKEIATVGAEGGDTYEDSTTNVNILKGTDFNNMSIWTYGGSVIRKENTLEGLTSLYGTGVTSSIQLYVHLEPDTYYTLSWWSKSNRAFVLLFYMFNGTYDYIIDGVENTGSGNSMLDNYVVAGSGEEDWTYHTLVFLNTYTGSNTPYIEFHTSGISTYYHEICMPKLEKGLTATQWTGGAYNKVSTSDNIGDIVLYNILEKKNVIVSTNDINAYDYPADKYVPIGILMIPASENVYNNYKAGVISLKYMDNTNPDVGTSATNGVVMYWGYNSTQWNTAVSSTSDALTDYKGWVKSQVIAENITSSYWKTSATIGNSSSTGNYPAIGCCWRYTTAGTMPGDWYLPAAGELYKALTSDNITIFNNSVDIVNDIYGSGSAVGNDGTEGLWSSSESSSTYAYIYRTTTHNVNTLGKITLSIDSGVLKARAFIQI